MEPDGQDRGRNETTESHFQLPFLSSAPQVSRHGEGNRPNGLGEKCSLPSDPVWRLSSVPASYLCTIRFLRCPFPSYEVIKHR